MTPAGRPRPLRRPPRRGAVGLVVLLAVLVVLVAAFVFGDRAARDYTERQVADELTTGYAARAVDVDIPGWPFLTQLARGDLDTVRVTAEELTPQPDQPTLHDVRLDLRGVARTDTGYSARELTGSSVLDYADLGRRAGATIGWAGADDQGRGRVKLDTGVTVLGVRVQTTVTGRPELRGTNIGLADPVVQVSGQSLPQSVNAELVQRIAVPVPTTLVPPGTQVTEVSATEQGVASRFSGQQVQLNR